jgi:hypothetical protein
MMARVMFGKRGMEGQATHQGQRQGQAEGRRQVSGVGIGRRAPKQPLLVFIHVRKTAGTALRRILALNEVSTPGLAVGNWRGDDG